MEVGLQQVLDDPWAAPAVQPKGAAQIAVAELQALMATLAARPPELAMALMKSRLAQDWSDLPARWSAGLVTAVEGLTAKNRRWLQSAASREELLQRACKLGEQPGLVLSTLAALSVSDLRWRFRPWGAIPDDNLKPLLHQLATAWVGCRETMAHALKESVAKERHLGLQVDLPSSPWRPHCAAAEFATALLADEESLARLRQALVDGMDRVTVLAPLAAGGGLAIKGLAFGVHGRLHGVLQMAKDADERVLLQSSAKRHGLPESELN
jgi:hypothetical protein